jgi:hypothetical protein
VDSSGIVDELDALPIAPEAAGILPNPAGEDDALT